MNPYWTTLMGSLLLSAIHASIPNHWVPLVVLGKTEKWTPRQAALYTTIAGFAHTASTVLVGIAVGEIGVQLSQAYQLVTRLIAPLVLIALGVIYLIRDTRSPRHHRHDPVHISEPRKETTLGVLLSLSVAMFFSPCMEIEAYYFVASGIGWRGIWIVSVVYVVVTVLGMVALTWLGRKGMERVSLHILEHHEKAITGVVLLLLGTIGIVFPF
jgi:membrane protein DedA with SNARE-associated domain